MPLIEVRDVLKDFRIPSVRRETVREHVLGLLRPPRVEILRVLDGISFDVEAGQTVGIMGRNGSGKSTLLKIVSGIYTPDRGTVRVRGPLTPILELGVGWNPELDAVDNILLLGTVMGLSLSELEGSIGEILDFAELARFARLPLKHYSTGMAARLAYAVAFRAVREILVLDEVFAVGDASFKARCEARCRALRAAGHTILIVSHSPETVAEFCDRAILIEGGRIVAYDRADRVGEAYARLMASPRPDSGPARAKGPEAAPRDSTGRGPLRRLIEARRERRERDLLHGRPDPAATLPLTRLLDAARFGPLARAIWHSRRVFGWTRGDEAVHLAEVSYNLADDAVIVEIGAFAGQSAILLAGARKAQGSGRVHCVDTFDASGDPFSVPVYRAVLAELGAPLRDVFEENIRRAGLTDWVQVHVGRDTEVARGWMQPIDLLFLDGDQGLEAVSSTCRAWLPFLKTGGFLVVHNSRPGYRREGHDGSARFVERFVHEPFYAEIRCVDTTTFARKCAAMPLPEEEAAGLALAASGRERA